MASEYEYKPLPDEDSTRVVILAPGKGDEPLSGVLKVIHLSNRRQTLRSAQRAHKRRKTSSAPGVIRWTPNIPYEAISYVWGSDAKNHIILLSGKTHRITASLSDALHQCRFPNQSRALWADSICIDQDKLEEKNHQVYMMGRIYSSSQRTLICLGTDPDNRDHARKAFGMLSDTNRMIQETYQSPDFSWEANSFPWPLPDDPLINDSRWQSVAILASNPWFLRGWVVQEAVLGREARILWASFEAALLDFIRAETWYYKRARHPGSSSDHIGTYVDWRNPVLINSSMRHARIMEFRVYFESGLRLGDDGILFALHYARMLGLSNPRDRIYAFMALPFVRNTMPALHPDYSQPHLEVYRDFAIRYLEQTSDLNLLCYVNCEEGRNEESLQATIGSSWVPRWDCHASTIPPGIGHGDHKFGRMSAQAAEFVVMQGQNGAAASLQVRAVIFDSIRLVSPQLHQSMTIKDLITSWSQWSKQAGFATASSQDEARSANESMMFLSAMSRGVLGVASAEEWAACLNSYSKLLQNGATDPGCLGNSHTFSDVQICHRKLMDYARGSHVFLLGRGCHGLGSSAIGQDDVCAFVFGVSLPLILRKVPEAGAHRYRVIGSAFVLSKNVDELGHYPGFHILPVWTNWDKLCEFEGLADWGLKEEEIILI